MVTGENGNERKRRWGGKIKPFYYSEGQRDFGFSTLGARGPGFGVGERKNVYFF